MTPELSAVVIVHPGKAAGVGVAIDELTLEQLIATEPLADTLVSELRTEIGRKLRETRAASGLSLEDMRDKHGIDSGSLSRIERGQRWSADTAREALRVYLRERGKQERAGERKAAKAAKA